MPYSNFCIAVGLLVSTADACTVLIAGKKATVDGATLLLHTDDCANCDFRLGRVHPSRNDLVSAPVLRFRPDYPREVSTRSPTYSSEHLDDKMPSSIVAAWSTGEWVDNQTLGHLEPLEPKVAAALGIEPMKATLGTLEGLYSMVNSAQLAVVETTGSSNPLLFNPSRPNVVRKDGKAVFSTKKDGALYDVSQLTKAALARCTTARCAIDFMGYLAVRDGFYGQMGMPADAHYGGEILLVADPKEAWAFHVTPLPPKVATEAGIENVDEGHSAVWVAQRIPDDHFLVGANRFMIRDVTEVLPDSLTSLTNACRGESFRHSSNLFQVAEYLSTLKPEPNPLEQLPPEKLGVRLMSKDKLRVVDWLTTFGGEQVELAAYTNDRVWRVLSEWAPGTEWTYPAQTPLATNDYPFSAKPTKPLTRAHFLKMARDVYRGSKHEAMDLTKGKASGPFGDPSRYDVNLTISPTRPGHLDAFPRAISMFRTSYSHVTEIGRPRSEKIGARVWASQGAPHASIYSPIHALPAALSKTENLAGLAELPMSFTRGSLHRADALDQYPEKSSIFWRTTAVNNWARAVGYDFAWDFIEAAQKAAEDEADGLASDAEEAAYNAKSPEEAAALLAAADHVAAARSAKRHRMLLSELMTRLHDGYLMDPYHTTIMKRNLFYPVRWLQAAGYYKKQVYPCNGKCGEDWEEPIEGPVTISSSAVVGDRIVEVTQAARSSMPWQDLFATTPDAARKGAKVSILFGLTALVAVFAGGVGVGVLIARHGAGMKAGAGGLLEEVSSEENADDYRRIGS